MAIISKKDKQAFSDQSRRSARIDIQIGTLEDLLNEIDYAIAPYMEDDEYDEYHWSRMLKKKRDVLVSYNRLEITDK